LKELLIGLNDRCGWEMWMGDVDGRCGWEMWEMMVKEDDD
jgi:hypothetical protein